MNRLIHALLCGLLFTVGNAQGGDKDKGKEKDTVVHDVKAADFAKEFEKSPADALKKYQAPKKGVGGATINLSGRVRDVKGKSATFDTGSKVQVMLTVDRISWPAAKGKRLTFDVTGAKLVEFRGGTVVLEAEEVVIGNLPDDEKKETAKEKK
jgi:hypothetical protein